MRGLFASAFARVQRRTLNAFSKGELRSIIAGLRKHEAKELLEEFEQALM
jgi:hypothetical protein